MTLRLLTGCVLVLALTIPAEAQISIPTSADIEAAIRAGTKEKGKTWGLSLVQRVMGTEPLFRIHLETPLTRVLNAASTAAKRYETFTVTDVTEAMRAPVLTLTVFPRAEFAGRAGTVPGTVIEHVVIRSADKAGVVQPLVTKKFPVGLYEGLEAEFSLEQVKALRGADGTDEFVVTVIGNGSVTGKGETDFKVQRKHFDDIP